MRKLHPSYEIFVKEQRPKYKQTFIEWYTENYKLGDIDLLQELQKKNKWFKEGDFIGYTEEHCVYYFKDFFTKKLQLCQNLFSILFIEHQEPIVKYGLDKVVDITDLYEEIIQEICVRDNVYVTYLPNGIYKDMTFHTQEYVFKNFNELIEEISTGIIIVYNFKILDDLSINVRYFKREPLTRTVLFEAITH